MLHRQIFVDQSQPSQAIDGQENLICTIQTAFCALPRIDSIGLSLKQKIAVLLTMSTQFLDKWRLYKDSWGQLKLYSLVQPTGDQLGNLMIDLLSSVLVKPHYEFLFEDAGFSFNFGSNLDLTPNQAIVKALILVQQITQSKQDRRRYLWRRFPVQDVIDRGFRFVKKSEKFPKAIARLIKKGRKEPGDIGLIEKARGLKPQLEYQELEQWGVQASRYYRHNKYKPIKKRPQRLKR